MTRLTGAAFAAALALLATPAGAQLREGNPRDRMEYIRWFENYPYSDDAATIGRLHAWQALSGQPIRAAILPAPGGRGVFSPLGPFGVVQMNGFYFSAPQAEGGRVAAIAIDPVRRNVVYAGAANGGVWKSVDGGFSWRALTDDQCGMTIGAIVVDPVNPDIVYASTGEPVESRGQACGVLRSANGGETWTPLGTATFDRVHIWALHIDPRTAGSASATTLLAATSSGLYRSENSGGSWTQVIAGRISDVVGHGTDGATMYAARHGLASTPGALFRSTNGGTSWSDITGEFPASAASRIELATSPARPDALFILAGRRSDSRILGVFRWEPATGVVTLPRAGLEYSSQRIDFGTQSWYNLAIAVDPANADRIYVAGVRAFVSDDGGTNFTEMAGNVHVDWHAIRIDPTDPTRIFAGNDGGIFVSLDRGASWQSRNLGMSTLLFYPGLSVHPSVPGYVLGGLQDNGAVRSGSFTVFEGVSGGDGAFTAINHLDPTIFWSSCQRAALQGCLYRHSPAGRSTRRNGISLGDRHPFIAPLVMSPTDPTRLYYATQRLWRTTNEGLLWTARSSDLTKGSGTISAIAEAPADVLNVYVGTNDGNVWVSVDGTETWRGPAGGLPNRSVTDFAIDPVDANRAWVTLGGFGTSHVYFTDDAGLTWTDVGGGLPDVPAYAALAISGTSRVFVGTDIGVYESLTGGPPWIRVPGLPVVRTTDLVFQPRFNLVIAGTYGRGLWGLDIGAQETGLRGDIDRNGTINATDALLIQQVVTGQPLASGLSPFPNGDADCDGVVSLRDAVVILRHLVQLPTGGACVGTVR